jgi:hypothetical protein
MSAPPTINGTSGAYEQPQRFGADSSGPYCIRTWKGTAAAIADQYNLCIAGGAQAEVQAGIGVHTVTARYAMVIGGTGAGEVPINSWQFFASASEKDALEADKGPIDAISVANKDRIRWFLANPPRQNEGAVTVDCFEDDGTDTLPFDLYRQMQTGVKSVRVNAPILRHTQTVSTLYTVKAALTNVGKILTSNKLYLDETIPLGVLFTLPSDVSTRYKLFYGWFKMHPSVHDAARQKMQIEQEWEYGLWSELLYGPPVA